MHVTPLAPRRLAAVPDGLRANGNTYRVEMTYEPRGGAVTRLAQPGTMLIEIPELGDALFTSPARPPWTTVAAQPLPPRELSMSAQFRAPGFYLGATSLPELASPAGRSHRTTIILGVTTAVVALVAFTIALVVVRRRGRVPT